MRTMRDNRKINSSNIYVRFLFLIPHILVFTANGQSRDDFSPVDVLHYEALVEPDIPGRSIKGKVSLRFFLPEVRNSKFKLDCGDLVIESVQSGGTVIPFERQNNTIVFSSNSFDTTGPHNVEIKYHGNPKWGIRFFPESDEVYTVFSTSRWLVCNDSPDDKATLELNIKIHEGLQVVSVGTLTNKSKVENGKVIFTWKETKSVPTYTFGFVAGHFNKAVDQFGEIQLEYFSHSYTEAELKKIFKETGSAMGFFQAKSGVAYPGKVYSQVETQGTASQEMSGFCVLRSGYGKQVLKDSTDINLSAHELAHQWWGNQVTCRDWNHFWLNEGFAVFMSSAFKEHRFGRAAYLKDIEIYFDAYQKVALQGKDKPLVFSSWSNPTPEDRTLVYYKGAYVLHLLREELGEDKFWAAIKLYTVSNFGKSLDSKNLQQAMEKSSGKNHTEFFSRWIY